MSISSQSSRADYTGNGTQSVFSYAFKIFKEADLRVLVRNTSTGVESVLTLTTDYTINGVGETTGGNVTLVDAGQAWLDGDGDLDTGYVMTIRRAPELVQETDIRNQGQYYPEGIENQFDKQVMIDQKQQEELDRSIRLPETQTDSDFSTTLPTDFAGNPDRALVSNNAGDGFDLGPTTDEIANAQAYAIDADEHKQTAERWANLTTDSVTDVDTGVDSGEYSAKAYAIGGTEVTETAGRGAAKEWATKTDNPVDTIEFSAKEYAQGTQASTGGSSKDWAQKTDADVNATGEYSAKEYAQGVQAGTGGSAKDWAQETASDVDGVDYSSKEYAQGIQTRGLAGGGSAKDWAQYTAGTVDDVEYSSKKYAQDAAASAAAAATTAAASLWQDVVFKTFADTPISIVDSDTGKMFAIDCSGGNVVVNLPLISGLTLTGPWSVGIQKSDNSSNTITINANASDTIDGGASITLTKGNATATLIPDTDPTPDEWTPIIVGEYPVTGNLVGDTDTQTLTGKTMDANNNTFSNFEHGAEVDDPAAGVHGVVGNIVGTSDAQTLSNKSISDALTFDEIVTPANPAASKHKIYFKSDGKAYRLNNAGEEVEIGSGAGGGSGGKNYFEGGDFETNVDLATAYDDGGAYVDGDGGSPSAISVSQETTSPLAGGGSLKISKAALDASGEGVTLESIAIDLVDRGRNLFVVFEWRPPAGYTDGDYKIHGFSTGTTNAEIAFFPVAGFNDDGTLPARATKCYGYFATSSDDDSTIRVSLHMASDSATGTAYDCLVDDAVFGPDQLVPGAIVTEWEAYVPTFSSGFGTTTLNFAEYRRIGENIEIRGSFVTGTVTTGVPSFTLPSGLQTASVAATFVSAGDYRQGGNSTDDFTSGALGHGSLSNVITFYDDLSQAASSGSPSSSANTNVIFRSATTVSFSLNTKIDGWSSGAMLSTTDVGLQTAQYYGNAVAAQSIPDNIFTTVEFDNEIDTHGMASGSTTSFRLTAKEDGLYLAASCLAWATSANLDYASIQILHYDKNDVSKGSRLLLNNDFNGVSSSGSGVLPLNMVKGDYIEIQVRQNDTGSASRTLNTTSNFSLTRIADFSHYAIYGETGYIESAIAHTNTTGLAAVSTWGDLTSIDIPPGTWDIGVIVQAIQSANATVYFGVSSTSGNVAPGPTVGIDYGAVAYNASGGSDINAVWLENNVTVTETTTFYYKFQRLSTTTSSAGGKLYARKVR